MKFAYFTDTGRVSEAHNNDAVTELPAGAVELTEDQFYNRFDLKLEKGILIDSPSIPSPLSVEEAAADMDRKRAVAYRTEADPLFFKSQRGECTVEEWQAKIAEIKFRYPKP